MKGVIARLWRDDSLVTELLICSFELKAAAGEFEKLSLAESEDSPTGCRPMS
jgi:hypothetical protein